MVETRHGGRITVREENAAAAIEVMNRFAIAPQQLLYLPPTMSPSATTSVPGLLEHPAEAFAQCRAEGVAHLVCQGKHMGSRAVELVRRADLDPDLARSPERRGALYTRTGRSCFPDAGLTAEILSRLARAVDSAGLFNELDSYWVLLDAELLPWSVKAGELIRSQYAAAGAAVPAAVHVLEQAAARGLNVAPLLALQEQRATDAALFTDADRRYFWPTNGLADVSIAPFQVLASAGQTFSTREHGSASATSGASVAWPSASTPSVWRRSTAQPGPLAVARA